ncbi:MAG: hypothetical protein DI570_05825 [Phenylobacterium zucineum]|nr:MAG: hypothetical protein DI570_05825 [Phenylobacterium zucineum]
MTAPDNADLKAQLLGFAFAGADLVFEADARGKVTFALGAVAKLTGRSSRKFIGADWTELFEAPDDDLVRIAHRSLKPGQRHGPMRVTLRHRAAGLRMGSLSLFKLPERGDRLSCALSLAAAAVIDAPARDDAGFLQPETFPDTATRLIEEASRAGLPLQLDLVEMKGLAEMASGMDASSANALRRMVAATMRVESHASIGAAEVAHDRFALVSSSLDSATQRLVEGLKDVTDGRVAPTTAALPLSGDSPSQNLRAMRHALSRYIEAGPAAAEEGFAATVRQTVSDTARFRAAVSRGDFNLVYQPVIDLQTGAPHHFEALARFDKDASPAETIRLAEELGLIADFDLAVVAAVARELARNPALRIAANLSAASFEKPNFVRRLLQITAFQPSLRSRLPLELTETEEIRNLTEVSALLAELREAGHQICLDDFGVGAASLNYLRRLDVDVVKIDGSYIQLLTERPRDVAVLRHVVALCRELGIVTIAEMVETPETAELVRDLGIDQAQGWHFGKPTEQPAWTPATAPTGRRKGTVDQWG